MMTPTLSAPTPSMKKPSVPGLEKPTLRLKGSKPVSLPGWLLNWAATDYFTGPLSE